MPDVPTHSEFAAVRDPQPYRPLRPEPRAEWDALRQDILREITRSLQRRFPYTVLPAAFARAAAARRISVRWPPYRDALEALHRELSEDRAALEPGDREGWADGEQRRTARLVKLLENDPGEIFATACEVLSQLRFPFPTVIDAGLESPGALFIAFQLPELESVIQPTTRELLRSGEIRKVKREKEEQHRDFSEMAVGLAFHAAAFVYSHIPYLQDVVVAAYQAPPSQPAARSRRARARSSAPAATFLYEIPFEREDCDNFDATTFDPIRFIFDHAGRVAPLSNVALGRIEAPAWLPNPAPVDPQEAAAGPDA